MRKRSYSRLDLAALVILILAIAIGPVMSAFAAPGNSADAPGRNKSAVVEVSPIEELQEEAVEEPVVVVPAVEDPQEEPEVEQTEEQPTLEEPVVVVPAVEDPQEEPEVEQTEEQPTLEEPPVEVELPIEEETVEEPVIDLDPELQEELPLQPEILVGEEEIEFTLFGVGVFSITEPSYTEEWDGRGTDSLRCDYADGNLRPETGWIHWVFSTKGDSTDAQLILGGTGTGTYPPGPPLTANTWHFYTPYFELDGLTATIELFGGAPGSGGGLVISDYCPGQTGCLKIVKEWDGYDDVIGFTEAMIPDSIQVRIDGPSFPDGKTVTLYKSDDWVHVECGLKLGDYTVTELFNDNKWHTVVNPVPVTVVAGNTPEEAALVTVTNTYKPGCLKITKVWKFRHVEGYENIEFPEFIEVIVKGPSFPEGETFILRKSDSWRMTICKLIPGDYTVKEVPVDDWKTTSRPWSGSVTVTPGSNRWNAVKVELTNTFITGCLKISKAWYHKDVVGFDPETMIPSKVEISVKGPSYPDGKVFELTKDSGWKLTICKLIPGIYEVEEVTVEGWTTKYWPQSGKNEVMPGSTFRKAAEVKIINKFDSGCLEINKEFVFGEMDGFVFDIEEITVRIVGPSFPAPGETFTIDIDLDGTGSRTWCKLIPGDYVVTEESVGSEWMVVISDYGEVTVVAEETAVVDITNTYIVCYNDETAWALGNIGFIENLNLKNWGWSNELGEGTHYRDLYAGAGQNDITKGELVGQVKIVYDEGCVTVTYIMNPGVQLLEAHVWIDEDEPLPYKMQGGKKVYNSAPGQLGFEAGEEYCGFSGDIFVAAHAVVRIPVVCPEQ